MSRSQIPRKDDRPSRDDASSLSGSERADESPRRQRACGKLPKALASAALQAHDSIDWRVTDDWPEEVPITQDEIEIIEAYLRDAIDALLK
jgi:hypothetical protein